PTCVFTNVGSPVIQLLPSVSTGVFAYNDANVPSLLNCPVSSPTFTCNAPCPPWTFRFWDSQSPPSKLVLNAPPYWQSRTLMSPASTFITPFKLSTCKSLSALPERFKPPTACISPELTIV